jgi:hypothetical protein
MNEPEPRDDADHLAMQAFLFACGELEDSEAEAYSRRLAEEQAAREALSRAVHLSGSLAGGTPRQPDPAYRARVRERLTAPARPAAAGVGPAFRGYPLLWAGAGAAAMYLVSALLSLWAPPHAGGPNPAPVVSAEPPPAHRPASVVLPVEEGLPPAEVWASLHTPDRLARVRDEEERRKSRADELQRLLSHDERRYQH